MPTNYKYKTEFYGIPIVAEGQRLSEKEEIKKFNIIENQLLAATKGVMCCVFDDGDYDLIDNVDGTYSVMLISTGQSVALEGILRGGYCYSKEPIVWQGLRKGKVYHLYVSYTDRLYADETAFDVTFKETVAWPHNLMNYLYLAKVDLTGENKIIDSNPDGKIYANDIACHVNDVSNPHGNELHQDTLVVKKLVFEMNDGKQVVLLDSDGNGILNNLLNK